MDHYEDAERHLDNGDLQEAVRSAEDALAESERLGAPPVVLHLLVGLFFAKKKCF